MGNRDREHGNASRSLTITIKTIQDIMRKDVGVDGDAQRIGQLVWMLFLKILDAREHEWELDRDYESPLRKGYRWRDWAAVEDKDRMTSDDLIAFVNDDLFPKLKDGSALRGTSELRRVIRGVFEDAYNYMKSGTLLWQVIDKIEEGIPFDNLGLNRG